MSAIFTIGHSTHPFQQFAALLTRNGVTAVADVRSAPYSRYNPQYNREPLKAALAQFPRPATLISESPDEESSQRIKAILEG